MSWRNRDWGDQYTETRYDGAVKDNSPVHRNAAVREILARNEVDLTSERDAVRGVMERVSKLFGRIKCT